MSAWLSERVHEWMGWCPVHRMTHFRDKTIAWHEMNSCALANKDTLIHDGIIVDYGKTGISLKFFIGAIIGIIVFTAFLTLVIRVAVFPMAGLPFCGLILSVVIITVYQDLKRARLEITNDALTIQRPLRRTVTIPKDTISTVEIRPNVQPFPLWIQKILILFVIPFSSAGVLYGRYQQFIAGEITSLQFFLNLGFDISIVLFFLAIYYHSRIRANYPEILVITTTTQKLAGVYGNNLKEIATNLEKTA
jgi:hypothetical protein